MRTSASYLIRRKSEILLDPTPRVPVASEDEEQCALIQWWAAQHMRWGLPEFALYAIPNGGLRHRVVAAKLKGAGVRKGIQDLNLDVPRGTHHGLRIEMKSRCRAARVRPDQAEVHAFLKSQHYKVAVCRGMEEAITVIKDYLGPTS